MKKMRKRCLAILLSIAMVITMIPVNSSASGGDTFIQISSISELTSGQYVMIVNTGYAPTVLDGTWVLASTMKAVNGEVVNPDAAAVWTITVEEGGVKLTDSNGVMVSPGSDATKNTITSGDYIWGIEENSGGFKFLAATGDARTLASNTGFDNKFRAYKNTSMTSNPDNYPTVFTLYKLEQGSNPGPVKAAKPKADPAEGVVAAGTKVTLSCATSGAAIQYKVNEAASGTAVWMDYSNPIEINTNTTIYAKAMAPGCGESDTAEFTYIVPSAPQPDPSLEDPITVIPEGTISIAEANELPKNDKDEISVIGQLVYRFGNYDNLNSAILQDVIDGQIVAIQVFGSLEEYDIGDVLKITGKKDIYGQVHQISSISSVNVVTPAANTKLIPAQEFDTINELKAMKLYLLSEKVLVKNVTLGKYNENGSTTITDSEGTTMAVYRAATYPVGVEAGEKVNLYACVSKYNTTDQLRVGSSGDYVVVNDEKAPVITMPALPEAGIGKEYPLSITIKDNVGVTEAVVRYKVNGTGTGLELALIQNAEDKTKWETIIPAEKFAAGVSSIVFTVTAKDAKNNTAASEPATIVVVDEAQVISVTPGRNAVTKEDKKPVISVTCKNEGVNPRAALTLTKDEIKVLDNVSMSYAEGTFKYQPTSDLADGRYTATVNITRADNKKTVYEWPFTVGTPEYSLYFGQLHSHTQYSDGAGTLDSALQYLNDISDNDNVDFVAFTDHSNYFDTKAEVNPEGGLYDTSLMTSESQKIWSEYKTKIADFNNSPDNKGVIALGGFEMTWSGGPGHINTFNTEGIVSRNNATLNNKSADAGMKAYYSLLSQSEGADSISQFNHPGKTFGTFSDFAYWDPVIDSRVAMVEVGNGEGAIGSGGYFPSYEYYTMALDKGWHVAPTNNQDNHKGKWGNANDARNVIVADVLTEEGIYDALRNHRLYSTEDKNLEITYTVNNQLMGSSIEEVPESLNVEVTLNDADDKIAKAEIIVNSGRVAYKWDVNDQSATLKAEIAPEYTYYYLRVTESDGDIAVTAPVWVGDPIVLGISSIDCSTDTPITDEELTLTTTMFNSELTSAAVKSVTYKLDGDIIDTVTDAGTIESSANLITTYKFTPKKAKIQKITVEVVLTLEGIDYTYTKDIELAVRDANKLVYIGIDGSHFNEYVNGNYKDTMGNFSKLAAEYGIRCVILNTQEEFLNAAANTNGKYKMLVLNAPSRRDGSSLRDPYATYSDEEVAAVQLFAETGGALVLCGWSDYYENYDNFGEKTPEDHMAAQQNKLLNAIGSTLRVSDDATNDDTLNGGQKQRLYFSSYNFNNIFADGIIFDKDHPNDRIYSQVFSHYGGASIHAVDAGGNPSSTLADSVSPLVYAHSTTYSLDSDNDGIGGENIPKYQYSEGDDRLMILATETLTHANGNSSVVIVDGASFMSNFEIQAEVEDTNAELNYSNYTILENIIKYVNPVQVSDIAQVQTEAEEGVSFTVEGIVTSNASGYDKDTAFFDCIYVQDDTAGINAFPVAGEFKIGQKVRITGSTSSYQGERQLAVTNISLLDDSISEVIPKKVTAKEINDKTYLGSLVELSGRVESFEIANGAVQTIIVKDNSGNIARVFIDGYITSEKTIDKLKVGNNIKVTGLSSYDNTFVGLPARIRVRDRADIICSTNVTPVPVPTPSNPEQADISSADATVDTTANETIVTVKKAETTVKDGKVEMKVELDQKALEPLAKVNNGNVTVILGEEALKDGLKNTSETRDAVLDLSIPSVEGVKVNNILLNTDALILAKESGKKLTINVKNADAKKYTISIPASESVKFTDESSSLNIAVSVEKSDNAAGILAIGTTGSLPAGMNVTIPVKEELGVKVGQKVYIYYRNPQTGELEEIPNNVRKIAENGTLKISTLNGGEFVVYNAKVKNAVKLVDKVKVSSKTSVATGRKITVKVNLPKELIKVTAFKSGDPVGQEEAKVSYKVNNKAIAAISKSGTITAKKAGTVKVSVTVTLENGSKKTITKNVKVK